MDKQGAVVDTPEEGKEPQGPRGGALVNSWKTRAARVKSSPGRGIVGPRSRVREYGPQHERRRPGRESAGPRLHPRHTAHGLRGHGEEDRRPAPRRVTTAGRQWFRAG